MNDLLKATAGKVTAKAYLSADHASDATGKTLSFTISKDGAGFTNPSIGAAIMTEVGFGWYYFLLSAADRDTLGPLIIRATGTGVDPVEVQYNVVETVVAANLTQILGTTLTETTGYLAAAFKKFFNVLSPTGTVNSLPNAAAGASGGLPTTDGSKLNQTADLTTGQSIAVSDKTGFSLTTAYDPAKTAAPTVVQIRTELAAELALIDASISSRLATGDYLSPDNLTISLIHGIVSLLQFDEFGNLIVAAEATLTPENISDLSAGVVTEMKASTGWVDDPTLTYSEILQELLDGGSAPEGAVAYQYTVSDGSNPIDGVRVEVKAHGSSDVVAIAYSDVFGNATFLLVPGEYDFYPTKTGFDFGTLPDTEVVT